MHGGLMTAFTSITADVRYALRSLRKSPAFTLVVVITLALGIGANTAIFSVVRGVMLKPLPHRDGDRLIYLRHTREGPGGGNITFSVPEVRDIRNGVPAFGALAEYSRWSVIRQGPDGSERVPVGLVTGNYFEVMGLSTILGRPTGPADDGPGVPPVAVLTHDYWMSHFGGDHGVVGKTIILDRKPVTVIGVLQPAPFFPDRIDALLNMVNSAHHVSASMVEGRSHRMTEIVARLKSGATLEQAKAQVAAVDTRLQHDFPASYDPGSRYRVDVMPFKEAMAQRAQLTLWLLMGAAAFVLIIAAANVANLTLMRGVRREHELVARAALGAGAVRLRRLLLAENLVLTALGGALGWIIAIGGTGLLTSLAARYSTRTNEIQLDGTVLAFAIVISVTLALLLSFATWLPKEGNLAAAITGGRRASGGLRRQHLQRGLVVVQVAVSVVLLACAGLLTRTMIRFSEIDTGLQTEEVLTMQVSILTPSDRDSAVNAAARVSYTEIRRELGALPGVLVAATGSPPLRRNDLVWEIKAEGQAVASTVEQPRAEWRGASPEYFRAAGIPLLTGRTFDDTDGPGRPSVVIINQTLANMLFPGQDPVGRRVAWTGELVRQLYPSMGMWRTVVGVAGDTRDGAYDAQPLPVIYTPSLPMISGLGGGVVLRADSNAANLIGPATRIVRRIAPTALIEDAMTITQFKEARVSPRRLNAVLLSSFGVLATLIAAVGIAGVLAFSVSARTHEIGIRMSLGADSGRVQRMILGEGGVLLALSVGLGVAGAFGATGLIRGLLFGVAPHDPTTFLSVALLMAVIGLIACWIPALRAARVDPAISMRSMT